MKKLLRLGLIALMSGLLVLTGPLVWAAVPQRNLPQRNLPQRNPLTPEPPVSASMPVDLAQATPSEEGEAAKPEAAESVPGEGPMAVPDPSTEGRPDEGAAPQEMEVEPPASPDAEDADAEDAVTESPEAGDAIAADELEQEEWFQRELLIEADRLYQAGQIAEAEALYREAKTYGWRDDQTLAELLPPEPFTDEAQLSAGAAVYWRESARGVEAGRESQALVPLKLLTEEYPAFIPAHLRYVELLLGYERPDEAEAVLERALTEYPANPTLLQAQVTLMMQQEQWIEASIASRQFALLNSDHPEAAEYETLADENLNRFKSKMNAQLRNNAIANVITGIAGYALTGGLFGPFTALNSTIALLQGEKAIGEQIANQAQNQLPMLENETVLAYVNDMGQDLAAVAGRDEFDYEFHVILDPELNAFALPGGKIFVNAGAIMATQSEAELAGLLAHELSHAVLSHGFQLVTQGNLTASITQYLPIPGLVTNALVNGYSRQMERQADIVGTQILAASGYAADGMHGLMLALNERYGDRQGPPAWLSTHPAPQARVDYLQALVERGGYNRYAYEGVASHEAIQALTIDEMESHKVTEKLGDESNPEDSVEDAIEEVREEQSEILEADPESETGPELEPGSTGDADEAIPALPAL
ncbi:MAG: M48 family metalloprotease [Cyanobacteria bacterium J06648_16]